MDVSLVEHRRLVDLDSVDRRVAAAVRDRHGREIRIEPTQTVVTKRGGAGQDGSGWACQEPHELALDVRERAVVGDEHPAVRALPPSGAQLPRTTLRPNTRSGQFDEGACLPGR
ncbi:hypothetical protein [Mumia flava]|uniref:hypothetical protein n=1 Tax=Mumia flava TaxID=1348852 RepID=UPI0012FD29B1|nr:hypothetical protein [Mumia flava]